MAGLERALRQFEAVEANLVRLKYLWGKIEEALPDGPIIVAPAEYNEWCIAFERIVAELPAIDGFRLECRLYEFDEAARMHIDAMEIGEFDVKIGVSKALGEQGELLDEYRIRFRGQSGASWCGGSSLSVLAGWKAHWRRMMRASRRGGII